MARLAGRTALVTGGAKGIGRATCLRLAEEGADVAVNYRGSETAARVVVAAVRALGRRSECYQADIGEPDACDAMVAQVVANFPGLDMVINNAGIGSSGIERPTITEATTEQVNLLLGANLLGPLHLCRVLVPHMRKARRGDIIMVSSVATQNMGPRMGIYSITKAGMEALAHTLAKEEREHRMRVNIIAPGLVETDMGRNLIRQLPGPDDMRERDAMFAIRVRVPTGGHRRRGGIPGFGGRAVHHQPAADGERRRVLTHPGSGGKECRREYSQYPLHKWRSMCACSNAGTRIESTRRAMPKEYRHSRRYRVQPGDSLWAIATSHDVTLDALLAANAGLINDPNVIHAGWELAIPGDLEHEATPPPGTEELEEYTVAEGDTLGAIALRWETTAGAIAELNGIPNPDAIAVGQRLKRPGPTMTAGAGPAEASPSPGRRERRLEFLRYPLDMPPAVITGGFREDYGGYLHRGIDLGGVAVGTPIFAPAAGVMAVHRPGDGWGNGSFGICAVLDHPGTPWWSIYAHMSRASGVADGGSVEAGDVIGFVGFTGKVVPEGPGGAHLHWQLSAHPDFPIDFQYIANPLDFLVQP